MAVIPWRTRPALAAGTLLVLALASPARAQTDCGRIAPEMAISRVGRYANTRTSDATGEAHAYGYIAELWRAGACVFGVLFVYNGLEGDPPRGRIRPARLDPKSGRLSFVVRVRVSVHEEENKVVPYETEYSFEGRLRPRLLAGNIVSRMLLPPSAFTGKERVMLRREAEAFDMPAFRSYGEWEAWVNRLWRLQSP